MRILLYSLIRGDGIREEKTMEINDKLAKGINFPKTSLDASQNSAFACFTKCFDQ